MSLARAIATGDLAELPSRRDEDWRWSDIRGLVRALPDASPAYEGVLPDGPFSISGAETMEIVNGRGPGRIAVAKGEQRTLVLRYFAAGPGAHASRMAIDLAEGSELVLLESRQGDSGYLAEADLAITLGAGARLERVVIADEAKDAVSVSKAEITFSPHSVFDQTVVTIGAKRQRIETCVDHVGAGAMARLDGLYLVADQRHADITTVVVHSGPDGSTGQLTKGVATGQGRGVFQGRIEVARGSDRTDARMGHHALVLSDRAEVDAKPELEIYADDVVCSHGNSIGALDEEALFYARQRGIPEADARAMLTEAFVGEVADRIAHPAAREAVRAFIARHTASLMSFDVQAIRGAFPILKRQVNGQPLIYLDNAASAQKPRAVIEAMTWAMENAYANVHRGLHTLATETTDAYEAAREAARRLINAAGTSEIVFTKGGTEAINLVASSFGAAWGPGDEIVLTEMEHHANIVPWHFLRERQGVTLRFAPIFDDGRLDLERLLGLIGPRTRMVAVSQMSNVLGTVNPVAEIIAVAHDAGALTLIDGCQAVVHRRIDVQALSADFYVFSGHKLYGPTGIGVLYAKGDLLSETRPYQGGGEMIDTVTLEAVTYGEPPHKFEAGTPPILEAIGLGAAIAWLGGLDRDAIAVHEHELYERVKAGINGANWVTEVGQAPGKGAIFAFNMAGAHAHDVAQVLDRYGVAVRAGTHCAEPLMRRFGVTGSVRASFALYNTLEEADSFVDALHKTRTFFA